MDGVSGERACVEGILLSPEDVTTVERLWKFLRDALLRDLRGRLGME